MELIKENVKVEWEQLGEGLSGDYDPKNPNDIELLRFYISKKTEDGFWGQVSGGSFCTLFPASASDEEKKKGLELIMEKVFEMVQSGESIKQICEELSWINQEWIKNEENDPFP